MPLRKKEFGWNPHANKATRKEYARLVLESPPPFLLLDHLCTLSHHISVEEVDAWQEDIDLSLAHDLKLEIPEDYEDVDPSTPTTEAEADEENIAADEEGVAKNGDDRDNTVPPLADGVTELPQSANEGTPAPLDTDDVPVSDPEVNTQGS